MIGIKYYYKGKEFWKYFQDVNTAIRFMYVLKKSPTMTYSGEFSCDSSWECEQINRKFR